MFETFFLAPSSYTVIVIHLQWQLQDLYYGGALDLFTLDKEADLQIPKSR